MSDLKNDPSFQRVVNMPDHVYQLFKQADPIRAQIIDDCREAVKGE